MYSKQLTTRSGHKFVYESHMPLKQDATEVMIDANRSLSLNRVARFNSSVQVGEVPKRRAKAE
jgi:hypothetical protein